jgi:hypothetical protein
MSERCPKCDHVNDYDCGMSDCRCLGPKPRGWRCGFPFESEGRTHICTQPAHHIPASAHATPRPAPERPEPGAASPPEREARDAEALDYLFRFKNAEARRVEAVTERDAAERRALAAERDLSSLRAGVERLAEEREALAKRLEEVQAACNRNANEVVTALAERDAAREALRTLADAADGVWMTAATNDDTPRGLYLVTSESMMAMHEPLLAARRALGGEEGAGTPPRGESR